MAATIQPAMATITPVLSPSSELAHSGRVESCVHGSLEVTFATGAGAGAVLEPKGGVLAAAATASCIELHRSRGYYQQNLCQQSIAATQVVKHLKL